MNDDGADLIGRVFTYKTSPLLGVVIVYSRTTKHDVPALVVQWDTTLPETVAVSSVRRWLKAGDWYE
jgi:hypothetical protein